MTDEERDQAIYQIHMCLATLLARIINKEHESFEPGEAVALTGMLQDMMQWGHYADGRAH